MPTKRAFMPLMRELVRCYQAFEHFSLADIRECGLTAPQFDVIATLGNTEGLTFKELGEKTLITKGTLTGVVDRLVDKGLVQRLEHPSDARCFRVVLTTAGSAEFERVFIPHLNYLEEAFELLTESRRIALTQGLSDLRLAFETSQMKNAKAFSKEIA